MKIRSFASTDYPAFTALMNAVLPEDPRSSDEVRFWDMHQDPKCQLDRWLVEHDGQIVAGAEYSQSVYMYHPRKFWLDAWVHPEFQGQGLGSRLYDTILAALQPLDPLSVWAQVREDMSRGLRFLQARGFQEEMRSWPSTSAWGLSNSPR